MKVDVYSDVICPWCYFGQRRLAKALNGFAEAGRVEVVYRAFRLDPELPSSPVPLMTYLRQRFGGRVDGLVQHVTDTARQEGIEIDWENALAVETLTAHRLLRLAEREHGAAIQHTLLASLFEAHFQRGANVADHALLTELAASAGMDGTRTRQYLTDGEGLDETLDELERTARLGIRAVPTFVFNERHALQGAQPPSVLLDALEKMATETPATSETPSQDSGGDEK